MEAKINIVEILKDKPQGTKLYSSACGKCKLEEVYDKSFKISFYNSKFGFMNGGEGYLDKNGKLYDEGECVVFPSREMRDWEKFAWKKGDVLAGAFGASCIFDKWANDDYTRFDAKFVTPKSRGTTFEVEDWCKITNEACIRQYIRDIEEDNGGKLNLTTLEIENNQPEFKDGDIVCISGMGYLAYGIVKSIDNSSKKLEYYALNDMSTLKTDDWLSFEDKQIQPITETQQIILFDALAKKGKAWDAEKKQIVDLKPKWTPKPFDRVITRVNDDAIWTANIFSHIDRHGKYVTIGCISGYDHYHCLPYNEETAKLIGTTNNWEG